MATYYASCHTPDNFDLDRRIQGLGGHGWGWLQIDTIIQMIGQGHTFYTSPPIGNGQMIIVDIHPRSRRPYIKTIADGVEPNNILALPRCS
jgi:hypothetical protein